MSELMNQPIDLECPACGRQFQETLGRLEGNPEIVCPGCGGTIEIQIEGRERLREADRALSDFQRAVDDLNDV